MRIKDALSGLRQFLATESLLKMIKDAFYFTLKALFAIKIFQFLPWLFGHYKNGLIRRVRLISKYMTSKPGQQTIAIQILPNISRSKEKEISQKVKKHFTWKNHTQNAMEKLFRDSFLENEHWGYLWINNSLKFYKACLHCMPRWRLSKYT